MLSHIVSFNNKNVWRHINRLSKKNRSTGPSTSLDFISESRVFIGMYSEPTFVWHEPCRAKQCLRYFSVQKIVCKIDGYFVNFPGGFSEKISPWNNIPASVCGHFRARNQLVSDNILKCLPNRIASWTKWSCEYPDLLRTLFRYKCLLTNNTSSLELICLFSEDNLKLLRWHYLFLTSHLLTYNVVDIFSSRNWIIKPSWWFIFRLKYIVWLCGSKLGF